MNIYALIIGAGHLIMAALDGCGAEIHEWYSGKEDIKTWQKTRAVINMLNSVACIIIFLSYNGPKIQYYMGCMFLIIGYVLQYIWERKGKA